MYIGLQMAKPKRTETQRSIDLAYIERLHLKGMGQIEIAEQLNKERPYQLSYQQIGYDLRSLAKMWREEARAEVDEAKAKALAELKILQATYWEAWQKSCTERTKTKQDVFADDGDEGKDKRRNKKRSRASVEKETLLGNPAYLAGVQSCIEQRCKIIGLYAPTKSEVTGKDGAPLLVIDR